MKPEYCEGEPFEVTVETLDHYTMMNNIQHIDFMKIDTEGAERDIFRGAAKLLSTKAIQHVMFEVNETCLGNCGTSSKDLVADAKRAGFILKILDKDGTLLPCPDEPKGDWITVVGQRK